MRAFLDISLKNKIIVCNISQDIGVDVVEGSNFYAVYKKAKTDTLLKTQSRKMTP